MARARARAVRQICITLVSSTRIKYSDRCGRSPGCIRSCGLLCFSVTEQGAGHSQGRTQNASPSRSRRAQFTRRAARELGRQGPQSLSDASGGQPDLRSMPLARQPELKSPSRSRQTDVTPLRRRCRIGQRGCRTRKQARVPPIVPPASNLVKRPSFAPPKSQAIRVRVQKGTHRAANLIKLSRLDGNAAATRSSTNLEGDTSSSSDLTAQALPRTRQSASPISNARVERDSDLWLSKSKTSRDAHFTQKDVRDRLGRPASRFRCCRFPQVNPAC